MVNLLKKLILALRFHVWIKASRIKSSWSKLVKFAPTCDLLSSINSIITTLIGFEFGDQLTTRERTAITLGPSFSVGFGNGGPPLPLAPPPARRPPPPPPLAGAGFNARFRTRICRKWEYSGCCPYGDKCLFAHGESELQPYGGGWTPKNIVAASGSSVARADGSGSGSDHVPGVTQWKVPKKINRIYGDWIDDDE